APFPQPFAFPSFKERPSMPQLASAFKQALGVLALLSLAAMARATDLSVPSQYPTIQTAITAAAPGDTVLLDDRTYTGMGNHDLDFGGKAITVRSRSGDPTRCILDCGHSGRGFFFHNGETAASTVAGLTIQNGTTNVFGGGMYLVRSNPTITHCI